MAVAAEPFRTPAEIGAAVVVYTSNPCGYCRSAKALLEREGIDYVEVDVSLDHQARRWLVEHTQQRTVPQIFIHGTSIGGYQELAALARRGELERRVASNT